MKRKEACIYGIKYLPEEKYVYIGQTVSVKQRRGHHMHHLRKNKHGSKKLQALFNIGKDENLFKEEIIEEFYNISLDDLDDREIYYIAKYHTYNNLDMLACNMTKGGRRVAVPSTDKIKKKIRKTKRELYDTGNYVLPKGEIHGKHIVKEKEVAEIVLLLREGVLTQEEIGDIYGVKKSTIGGIATGTNWGHLEEVKRFLVDVPTRTPKIATEQELYLVKYYKEIENKKDREISRLIDLSYDTIRQLPRRSKYKKIYLYSKLSQ